MFTFCIEHGTLTEEESIKFASWILNDLDNLFTSRRTAYSFVLLLKIGIFHLLPNFLLLNVANPCMRSILFKGITNLAVADCLSDQDFSGMVQRVVQYGRCSSQELESFEAWISPQLDQLLLGKFSGLVVSKLFIRGKIFI